MRVSDRRLAQRVVARRAPAMCALSDRVELTKQAEDAWIELLLSGIGRMLGSQECTPGYYDNEGQEPGPRPSSTSAIRRARPNTSSPRDVAQHGRFEGLDLK
jgi:hypothetical protein